MNTSDVEKLAPYFWIGAGVMFFVAAALGKQIAFVGVGVMFLILGIVFLIQARKTDRS